MSFHPPLRPTKPVASNAQPKGFIESLAEQDDILLYLTAFLGVFMPGFVYFLYHRVHAIYSKYAERKEVERLKEERERTQITIFYACNSEEEISKKRAEDLCKVMELDASVVHDIATMDVSVFSQFKGFGIFILESERGGPPEKAEWFFEWLEDVAADKKQKKRTYVDEVKFAVLGLCDAQKETGNQFGKAPRTLDKRLKIVGAKCIFEATIVDIAQDDDVLSALINEWTIELMDSIDRNMPGGRTESEVEEDEFSESETDLSGDEIPLQRTSKKTK